MPQYLIGLLAAFGPPVFHGLSNILDNHLAGSVFKRLAPLIFISSCTGLLLLPVVFFIDRPQLLAVPFVGIAFLIAALEVLYLYPYYWSLRNTDTSIVAALFSLGRFLVPLFAYFLVGEVLHPIQYIGLSVVLLSSAFLTINIRQLRLNPALLLMLLVSAMLALQAVLFKYLFESGVGWGTAVAWVAIFEFVIALVFISFPANFREFKTSIFRVVQFGPIFVLNELLGWAGNMTSYFSVFLIPVSVAKTIGSTQPVFVLLFAFFISKKYPRLLREHMGKDGVRKKMFLFALIIFGVSLAIFG